jgi:hypothetical protein
LSEGIAAIGIVPNDPKPPKVPPPTKKAVSVDVSIPYDAAAKLAYEASDESIKYSEFQKKYEADAVAEIKIKNAGSAPNAHNDTVMPDAFFASIKGESTNGFVQKIPPTANGAEAPVEDWSDLTVTKLKRKPLNEIINYLKARGASVTDDHGRMLDKNRLVETALQIAISRA